MVPVSDVPVTELPCSAPLLSAPSKLKLVSTLTFLTPRACCWLSSAVGTADPASAPRIFPAPLFTLFSPARQEPCTQTTASSAARLKVADIFMRLHPKRSLKRDPHHGDGRGADRSVERAFNGLRCSGWPAEPPARPSTCSRSRCRWRGPARRSA